MTRNNSFFAPKGVNISSGHLFGPKQLCPSLAAWQAAGQDAGSRAVAGLPSPSEIVASAKALLGEPRTSQKKGLATIKMKSDDIARLPLSLPIVRPRLLLLATLSLLPAAAIENGLGLTPPKGWRSWNFYLSRVNETVMRAQMRAAVDKTRTVNGVPTSLAELGYGAACELQRSRRAHRHWRSSHSCVETTSPRAVASQAAAAATPRLQRLLHRVVLFADIVAMDDGWQKCNCSSRGDLDGSLPKCGNCMSSRWGPGTGGGCSFHNPAQSQNRSIPAGDPVVDVRRFPNMKDLVDFGHSLGLRVGGYLNNCICAEGGQTPPHYEQDVNWITRMGFDGVKIGEQSERVHLHLHHQCRTILLTCGNARRQLWIVAKRYAVGRTLQQIRAASAD